MVICFEIFETLIYRWPIRLTEFSQCSELEALAFLACLNSGSIVTWTAIPTKNMDPWPYTVEVISISDFNGRRSAHDKYIHVRLNILNSLHDTPEQSTMSSAHIHFKGTCRFGSLIRASAAPSALQHKQLDMPASLLQCGPSSDAQWLRK